LKKRRSVKEEQHYSEAVLSSFGERKAAGTVGFGFRHGSVGVSTGRLGLELDLNSCLVVLFVEDS